MTININSNVTNINTEFDVNGKETKSILNKLASRISNIKNSIANFFRTQETKSEDIYNISLAQITNEKKDKDNILKEREDLTKLHIGNRGKNNKFNEIVVRSQKNIEQISAESDTNSSIKEDNGYFLKKGKDFNIEELLQSNNNMEITERNMNFSSFKKIESINNSN
ncbi:hypothetical protein GY03_06660 [Proteus vulgaris]|uniref:hypothetical protein n=1 Tax=Proteus vulgaris TaxID=585 RepID=UPI0021B11575|nr:hypothetical protein [Proteus vulgaris]MCT6516960.1 hypothetical protein [Proteus vulgaris]